MFQREKKERTGVATSGRGWASLRDGGFHDVVPDGRNTGHASDFGDLGDFDIGLDSNGMKKTS